VLGPGSPTSSEIGLPQQHHQQAQMQMQIPIIQPPIPAVVHMPSTLQQQQLQQGGVGLSSAGLGGAGLVTMTTANAGAVEDKGTASAIPNVLRNGSLKMMMNQ